MVREIGLIELAFTVRFAWRLSDAAYLYVPAVRYNCRYRTAAIITKTKSGSIIQGGSSSHRQSSIFTGRILNPDLSGRRLPLRDRG